MDNLAQFLHEQNNNNLMPLEAIWLTKPINGKVRYEETDLICLDDNDRMIEGTHATHRILKCFGTIDGSVIQILVRNVIGDSTKIITL